MLEIFLALDLRDDEPNTYAPMIAAMPTSSARKPARIAPQIANVKTARVGLMFFRNLLMNFGKNTTISTAATQNPTMPRTVASSDCPLPPFVYANRIDNSRSPMMSSMTAAPRILIPVRVLSFPSSLSVSTVMLTLVAVSMMPIKTVSIRLSKTENVAAVPSPRGTSTPGSR